MLLHDVTWPLSAETPTFPGDPPFAATAVERVDAARPGSYALTALGLTTHTGTHVDFPAHVVPGGRGAEPADLALLCGPARVVVVPAGSDDISAAFLAGLALAGVERLLFKTKGAGGMGVPPAALGGPYLSAEAAHYLCTHTAVRLVGIDDLTIEAPTSPTLAVHRALLGAEPPILIVEGLRLEAVAAGDYTLWCLPLALVGRDGAPARAVLVTP